MHTHSTVSMPMKLSEAVTRPTMAEMDDWDNDSNPGSSSTQSHTTSSHHTPKTTTTNKNVENAATIRHSNCLPKQLTSLGSPETTRLPKNHATMSKRTSMHTAKTNTSCQSKHTHSDDPTPPPGHVARCTGCPSVLRHSDGPIPPPGPVAGVAGQWSTLINKYV